MLLLGEANWIGEFRRFGGKTTTTPAANGKGGSKPAHTSANPSSHILDRRRVQWILKHVIIPRSGVQSISLKHLITPRSGKNESIVKHQRRRPPVKRQEGQYAPDHTARQQRNTDIIRNPVKPRRRWWNASYRSLRRIGQRPQATLSNSIPHGNCSR